MNRGERTQPEEPENETLVDEDPYRVDADDPDDRPTAVSRAVDADEALPERRCPRCRRRWRIDSALCPYCQAPLGRPARLLGGIAAGSSKRIRELPARHFSGATAGRLPGAPRLALLLGVFLAVALIAYSAGRASRPTDTQIQQQTAAAADRAAAEARTRAVARERRSAEIRLRASLAAERRRQALTLDPKPGKGKTRGRDARSWMERFARGEDD